jgi:pyrimidine operon attenuation protein / uracil phosphoribosyltransferase
MSQNTILNNQEIKHKITRIAYQIYETFVDDQEIVIAGIASNGFVLAEKIAFELKKISSLKIILCEVYINKQDVNASISTSLSVDQYKNKGLVLVDDVLNSGTTLIYGVKHFLEVPLKKLKNGGF